MRMKPLTLSPQEVERAKTGKVILVRPVEPQPTDDPDYIEAHWSGQEFHSVWRGGQLCDGFDIDVDHVCSWDSPFGKVGAEFVAEVEHSFGDLTLKEKKLYLIHKGTKVKRAQDIPLLLIRILNIPTDSNGFMLSGSVGGYWDEKYGDKFPWDTNPWVFIGDMEVKK